MNADMFFVTGALKGAGVLFDFIQAGLSARGGCDSSISYSHQRLTRRWKVSGPSCK